MDDYDYPLNVEGSTHRILNRRANRLDKTNPAASVVLRASNVLANQSQEQVTEDYRNSAEEFSAMMSKVRMLAAECKQ